MAKTAKAAGDKVNDAAENIESAMKTGTETLHNELYTYSKQSIEESIAAAKTLLGAKSVHEAFELQSDFAKMAFDAYVGQVTKLSELFVATTKEALEPLRGRMPRPYSFPRGQPRTLASG